jgi:FtsP/CotA-like multicopper oxidase with cupredoxin domain
MNDRRSFLQRALTAAGFATAAAAQDHQHHHPPAAKPATGPFVPVETPDVPKVPFELKDGVKEFKLRAEVVDWEIMPGRTITGWGYNGSVPGPTIEASEGDRIRIIFENKLPEPTSIHWHGLEVPMDQDGVPGLQMDPILPGTTHVYEFTVHQHGTFFYHSHAAMQEMMGMIGMFVLHPKTAVAPRCDRDFGIILQEWAVLPNNTIPNTMAMEFNWLTLNGRTGPDCTPMIVKQGERIRIRIVNMGMDHHPMHLHGGTFYVTGTEGGRIPEQGWYPGNTVIVGVAQSRDVEFEAKYLGDWMLHCHLPHHMMNNMVSMVGPMDEHLHGVAANAKEVKGFPQDMWMPMDEAVEKPETYGLRKTWTAAMMGMMTLVRVVTPETYDKIQEIKKTWVPRRKNAPGAHHHHNG